MTEEEKEARDEELLKHFPPWITPPDSQLSSLGPEYCECGKPYDSMEQLRPGMVQVVTECELKHHHTKWQVPFQPPVIHLCPTCNGEGQVTLAHAKHMGFVFEYAGDVDRTARVRCLSCGNSGIVSEQVYQRLTTQKS